MKVVGLMSGTSADGIDAALIEVRGPAVRMGLRLLAFETFPYPRGVQQRLLRVAQGGDTAEICHLNFYLGELFADAVLRLLKRHRCSPWEVGLIGSHGQTIHHLPHPQQEGRFMVRSTLQIGEPSVIAERTGITTIADFRPRDMAAGGEGAPLTPYLHYLLFHQREKARLVVNIGGISNVTFLPRGKGMSGVLAFDAGPGNMVLDGIVARWSSGRMRMDRGGRLAQRGKVRESLLRLLIRHPFLKRRPPKSTGREAFGLPLLESLLEKSQTLRLPRADVLATATAFTVYAIASSLQWLPRRGRDLQEVIVGGGGVRNKTLVAMLKGVLAPIPVLTYEDFGFDSRAIEAMAFALFAYTTYKGIPNNVPSATGAKKAVAMGKIVTAGPFN